MKKIFIIIVLMLFIEKGYTNYSEVVSLPSGETIKVTGGNQEQVTEWIKAGLGYQNFNEIRDAMIYIMENDPNHKGVPYTTNTPTSIGCANGAMVEVLPPKTNHPTPPPAPVVTNSTSNQSCTYISSYSPNWSNCSINSNWNTNGNITCSQTNSWQANSSSASWFCTTTYIDGIPSGTSCNGSCPSNVSRPTNQTETKNLAMLLSNPSTTTNNAFANNRDTNSIRVIISGNTNQNKPITGLVGTNYANITDIRDNSGLKANIIDNSGANAINFNSVSDNNIQGSGNSFYFDITGVKSYAPISTNNGTISFKVNGVLMNLSNIRYKFDKLYSTNFATTNIKIGTTQKIELNVVKENNNNSVYDYNVGNINNSILAEPNNNYLLENKGNEYNNSSKPAIDLRINYKGTNNIKSNTSPYLSVNPIIRYNIDGVETKYYISDTKDSSINNRINSSSAKFDSIKIVGNIQSQGKAELTNQKSNFSDLSKSNQRKEIRKNATLLAKNRISGSVVNSIKYIEGDETISGDLDYETLIIKNGNLIISGNLNTNGKKIGIIVLKDGYNINSDYSNKGNIYINSNVGYINAMIYADGGIISSKNGTIYTSDSDSRTQDLNKQLVIKGSIFTRNTIGGAILGSSGYKLPGGQLTDDFDLAMIYDLNYIRRDNENLQTNYNLGNANNLVIIYNSSFQDNPPKGFNYN